MERLDDKISAIMADAENCLPEFLRFWWSDTLHNAFVVKEYCKAAISFKRNDIDGALILEKDAMMLIQQWTYSKEIKTEKHQHNLEKQVRT
eukprot:7525975-Ditylum_brightwellii.AAC.1